MNHKDERSKNAISFVSIRIIVAIIFLIISIITAKNTYPIIAQTNKLLAIIICFFIILLIMTAVYKTVIEIILKIFKHFEQK